MERRLIPVKLDTYKPLREIVFESIREAIINGTLKQGERLMETQLAEELGVSRTPVREAIRKLELEGLVVMVPRKGAYVAGISARDAADILEIRAALEGLAAKLAAERITPDEIEELSNDIEGMGQAIDKGDLDTAIEYDTKFHTVLISASRNTRLVSMVSNLQEQVMRFRVMLTITRQDLARDSLLEHRRIVDALSRKDRFLAQSLAKEHVEKVETSILKMIKEEKEED